ncbi:hypothetical protein [Saccharopolyspora hattusasensis]|uniref:hypothetical protein n=1 Tax=Saccharopolyspora hattusasensis TaxID=1128679 RepID=UPI003D966EC2
MITQPQLGEWLGVVQSRVSVIERSAEPRDFQQMRNWATLLGIPESLLWFRTARSATVAAASPSPQVPESVSQPQASVLFSTRPPSAIEAVRAKIDEFQELDRKHGGGATYPAVTQYLNHIIASRLVDVDHGGTELFSAAASVSSIAGWMAHDSGQDQRAHAHFERAERLALAACDPALDANVFAAQAHLAIQTSKPSDAILLAEAGLDPMPRSLS